MRWDWKDGGISLHQYGGFNPPIQPRARSALAGRIRKDGGPRLASIATMNPSHSSTSLTGPSVGGGRPALPPPLTVG